MKKTLVIGDIHGRRIWRDLVEKERDGLSRVIFIGDYLDTHEDIDGMDQLENLRDIVMFRDEQQRLNEEVEYSFDVVLLIGNHDFQYWPGVKNQQYSGYQPYMHYKFMNFLNSHKEKFKIAFEDGGFLFTHAGVTTSFTRRIMEENPKYVTPEAFVGVSVMLNEVFQESPWQFNFYGGDFSGYGNHCMQSCIWVRPDALIKDLLPGTQIQVVGHTKINRIGIVSENGSEAKNWREAKLVMVDTLGDKKYLVIEDGLLCTREL